MCSNSFIKKHIEKLILLFSILCVFIILYDFLGSYLENYSKYFVIIPIILSLITISDLVILTIIGIKSDKLENKQNELLILLLFCFIFFVNIISFTIKRLFPVKFVSYFFSVITII